MTARTEQTIGDIFDSLPLAGGVGTNAFRTGLIPGCAHHRIGKDCDGNAAVLIALDRRHPPTPRPPVVLEHLAVIYGVRCTVEDSQDGQGDGIFTVLRCTSRDPALRTLFLRLVVAAVRHFSEQLPPDAASQAIEQLINLFRAMRKPSTRSVQALWAELFLIINAANPTALLRAWRADPTETFDFSSDSVRVEVKSTRRRVRSHVFSLHQLTPIANASVVIASIFVERSSGGVSLRDLWESAKAIPDLDLALRTRVDSVVMTSLGRSWRRGLDLRFDLQLATQSLRFFGAEQVPCVAQPPAEISEVHFRSMLGQIEPLATDALRSRGQLASAACPKESD